MTRPPHLAWRWGTFVRERYAPLAHVVMAAAFAVGNAGVAASTAGIRIPPGRIVAAGALVVLFFLRLRVFDEIKDRDTDLVANPGRPLARGLLSVDEARRATWTLAAGEAAILVVAGRPALVAWAAAYLYSLAMYREFGIGAWLRPRMELYAVSHTLVASGLGLCVACLALESPLLELPAAVWLFAPANWALFNVFEFSRKTFAPSEERDAVESYSSRWGPRGATSITLAWVLFALGFLAAAGVRPAPGLGGPPGQLVFGLAALVLAAPYAASARPPAARVFRASMSGWAAALYLLVGFANLGTV